MSNYAKAILVGRVGSIEIFHTEQSMAIATISVAVNIKRKDHDRTLWSTVKAFGKLAEICEKYLDKGSEVFVDANIDVEQWEDKNGKTQSKTVFLANNIQFLGDKEKATKTDDVGF